MRRPSRIPSVLAWVACVCLAVPAPAASGVPAQWAAFQQALQRGDRAAVADLTTFPFSHPATAVNQGRPLTRAQFLERFDRVFSPGIRKQVAKGSLRRVTAREVREAQDDDLDPCGNVGEYVVEVPPTVRLDPNRDDESFLRLVFRLIGDRLRLHRVMGCE